MAFGYEAETIYSEARSNAPSSCRDESSDSDEDSDKSDEEYDLEDLLLFKHLKMMLMENKVLPYF